HLDLIVTDQRGFRSRDPFGDPSLAKLGGNEFLGMFPEDAMRILDGGRSFDGGKPPAEIRFNDASVPNPRKDAPPQTLLGAEQKRGVQARLEASTPARRIWGNTVG